MEFVGPDYRIHTGIASGYFWAISLMLYTLFAYFIRDWMTLNLVVSCVFTIRIDRKPKIIIRTTNAIMISTKVIRLIFSLDRMSCKKPPVDNTIFYVQYTQGELAMTFQYLVKLNYSSSCLRQCYCSQ